MPFIKHDGLTFHYHDQGQGTPFIFQHGLGGDVNQPFGLLRPLPGFRLLAFDCRGHGETRPVGALAKMNLASFADDVCMLMDHLGLPQAIVGGISMGAAVALNFALRFPDRLIGLVLSRPAWLDRPTASNAKLYGHIAQLIRQHGATRGLELFMQSTQYADALHVSSDAAASLAGQFQDPRAEEAVIRLERIPRDAPNRDRREWAALKVPTLVLASRQDPIHPFQYAQIIAQVIPDAALRELTPKSVNREQHAADVQRCIGAFLQHHFGNERGR